MPREIMNISVGSRKKKIRKKGLSIEYAKFGETPIKAVVVNATPVRRRKIISRLIASMDLDEMLEASKIVEMGFRGEKIPSIKSPKVQKYVEMVLQLNKGASTKSTAEKMQQALVVQIVQRNKKTTNAAEAKRLYHSLMREE